MKEPIKYTLQERRFIVGNPAKLLIEYDIENSPDLIRFSLELTFVFKNKEIRLHTYRMVLHLNHTGIDNYIKYIHAAYAHPNNKYHIHPDSYNWLECRAQKKALAHKATLWGESKLQIDLEVISTNIQYVTQQKELAFLFINGLMQITPPNPSDDTFNIIKSVVSLSFENVSYELKNLIEAENCVQAIEYALKISNYGYHAILLELGLFIKNKYTHLARIVFYAISNQDPFYYEQAQQEIANLEMSRPTHAEINHLLNLHNLFKNTAPRLEYLTLISIPDRYHNLYPSIAPELKRLVDSMPDLKDLPSTLPTLFKGPEYLSKDNNALLPMKNSAKNIQPTEYSPFPDNSEATKKSWPTCTLC